MMVREHFLLGTQEATISVTAKSKIARDTLFRHAMECLLARYLEEFGPELYKAFIHDLVSSPREQIGWRLKPEDSCWANDQSD